MRATTLATLVLLAASAARADGPKWQFQVTEVVKPGQKATLTLQPQNTVHEVTLTLTPGGAGKAVTFRAKKLPAGQAKTFSWAVPGGVSTWTGELTGSADGATTTAKLELKIAAVAPLDVQLAKKDIDLVGGRLVVVPSNPLAKAELKAWDATGAQIADDEVEPQALEGGKRFAVTFDVPDEANVRRVELKLHDAYGTWASLRVVRWYDEVEHDRVEFESGKWDIRPDEAPKLDRAIAALQKAIAKFRAELGDDAAAVDGGVYVAGYTDTVGSDADNLVLSRNRARAIAGYFAKHGVTLPIYYQGFGEAVQAVATADDVDEPHNRRALYVLTNAPPEGEAFPKASWTRLK
ncbi:MAG: OmpA family protein [Myxococcales bacterium]|nr:OmpA family protein [Myxococcales bacterium]